MGSARTRRGHLDTRAGVGRDSWGLTLGLVGDRDLGSHTWTPGQDQHLHRSGRACWCWAWRFWVMVGLSGLRAFPPAPLMEGSGAVIHGPSPVPSSLCPQEEFGYNAETQKLLCKNGETLLGAVNFFVSSINTLVNKTMEDTLMTVKQYETARWDRELGGAQGCWGDLEAGRRCRRSFAGWSMTRTARTWRS